MTETNQKAQVVETVDAGAPSAVTEPVTTVPVPVPVPVGEGEGEVAVVEAATKTVGLLESAGESPALVAAGVVLVLAVVAAVVRKLFL
jgi:hypothetical protein